MAIEKTDSFVGTCDNCGDIFDDGEFSLFPDLVMVKERIQESDWFTGDVDEDHKGKHYCPKCFKFHEDIDDKIIVDQTRKDIHNK